MAAGRAIPKEARAAAGEADPGASLPLFLDFLDKLKDEDRYCLFSDTLVLSRLDSRFLDRVAIEVKGQTLEHDLAPGEFAFRFAGLGIGENETAEATLFTKRIQRNVNLLRLPAAVLDGSAFVRAARLADRGCTLQALMAAEGGASDGKAK